MTGQDKHFTHRKFILFGFTQAIFATYLQCIYITLSDKEKAAIQQRGEREKEREDFGLMVTISRNSKHTLDKLKHTLHYIFMKERKE